MLWNLELNFLMRQNLIKIFNMEMIQDIQFITDNTGQKTFAIIPIDNYNSYAEYERKQKEKEDFL